MKRAVISTALLLLWAAPHMPAQPSAQQPSPHPSPAAAAGQPADQSPAQPAAPAAAQIAALPPPADRPVDFSKDIKPILQASCARCHARGRTKGGFSFETRDTLLEGGDSGPSVVAGKSAESHLVALVAGLDPDNVMPQKGTRLKPDQIGLLRAWIDQGMSWEEGFDFKKIAARNLDRRQPTLPDPVKTVANPVDRLLAPYFAQHDVTPGAPVDDRLIARRLYFDVIGLPPSPEELQAFVADRRPDKRARLVERLLADRVRYAEHWVSFWNDALRNDYRGPGYIDGGRLQISGWLYTALADNLPYDQFVAQLVNPVAGSEGFTKGIVWRGVVNASQTPPMQAAQNVSQVFMGVNLKCASCHDSFINDWQLSDAYGLASVYSDESLEMVECDKPTGRTAQTRFIYAKLGKIDAKAPRGERLKQLAAIVTSPENGRLSRTIVNRLWQRFMGRGLVEPVDDMEQPSWHPDLLDWLAEDLVANGYDLKKTMARILTSQAYQMASVDVPEQVEGYVFRGPAIRRLSAEQFVDALSAVTGVWQNEPAGDFDFRHINRHAVPKLTASWIWPAHGVPATGAKLPEVRFRKSFTLTEVPASAHLLVGYGEGFTLFVNGHKAGEGRRATKPRLLDVREHLRPGANVIAVAASRTGPPPPPPPPTAAPAPAPAAAASANAAGSSTAAPAAAQASTAPAPPPPPPSEYANGPKGLFVQLLVHRATRDDAPLEVPVVSDATWRWSLASATHVDGPGAPDTPAWTKPAFVDTAWKPVAPRPLAKDAVPAPWQTAMSRAVAAATLAGRTRAALTTADPLMVALGRPNREQVITTRASTATTLQVLELANGGTLATLLERGAKRLLDGSSATQPRAAVLERVYQRALNRSPDPAETALFRGMLGPTVTPEGVQDVLWAVAMLPEFQLIY